VAVISTVYSAAPMLSLYRSIQLPIAVVLVISLRERLCHLYMLIVAYVAVNWVLFLIGLFGLDGGIAWLRGPNDLYVDYGGNAYEAWRLWTAFGHPSHISIVAGVVAIGLAARVRGRQWYTHGPLIAWLLLTVMLTVSRSAIVAVVMGLGLVAATRRGFLPMVALGCGALFLVLLTPDAHQAIVEFLMRGQSAEDLASLSGRKQIYDAAMAHLEEAWFLGHGFRAARVYVLGDHGMVHAHNLILEVWLGLGVLGVVMACGVVLALVRAMLTLVLTRTIESPMDERWELVGIAIPDLTFCVLDSGFALEVNPFLMVIIAVISNIYV
jgi:O-antigen ligase